jgi:hypothetical protein
VHHVDVVDDSLWPNTIVSQTLWKSSQRYMKFNNQLLIKPYLRYEWKMENNIRTPWVKSSVVWYLFFKELMVLNIIYIYKCGKTFM